MGGTRLRNVNEDVVTEMKVVNSWGSRSAVDMDKGPGLAWISVTGVMAALTALCERLNMVFAPHDVS